MLPSHGGMKVLEKKWKLFAKKEVIMITKGIRFFQYLKRYSKDQHFEQRLFVWKLVVQAKAHGGEGTTRFLTNDLHSNHRVSLNFEIASVSI